MIDEQVLSQLRARLVRPEMMASPHQVATMLRDLGRPPTDAEVLAYYEALRAQPGSSTVAVVHGPKGWTESIPLHHVETLERLGLVVFEREDYVLRRRVEGEWVNHGRLHRFYRMADR